MLSDLTEAAAPWLHLSKLMKNVLNVHRCTHSSGIMICSSVGGHIYMYVCVCIRKTESLYYIPRN